MCATSTGATVDVDTPSRGVTLGAFICGFFPKYCHGGAQQAGLREDIIKLQWKMKSTRERWFGKKYDFYLIGHEHLYVFRKPEAGEKTARFRESMKWW